MNQKKVVLITGCSSGIGNALAKEFSKNKELLVYATARKLESIENLENDGCEILSLDVTKQDSINNVVETIVKKNGRIDILINNAGICAYIPSIEADISVYEKVMNVNYFGVVRMVNKVSPIMIKNMNGIIVNVSSVSGEITPPFSAPYNSSKGAVTAYTNTIRLELSYFGIKVMLVLPGYIKSNIGSTGYKVSDGKEYKYFKKVSEGVKKRAFQGSTDDVCTPAEEFAKTLLKNVMKNKPPSLLRIGKGSLKFTTFNNSVPTSVSDIFKKKRYLMNNLNGFNPEDVKDEIEKEYNLGKEEKKEDEE